MPSPSAKRHVCSGRCLVQGVGVYRQGTFSVFGLAPKISPRFFLRNPGQTCASDGASTTGEGGGGTLFATALSVSHRPTNPLDPSPLLLTPSSNPRQTTSHSQGNKQKSVKRRGATDGTTWKLGFGSLHFHSRPPPPPKMESRPQALPFSIGASAILLWPGGGGGVPSQKSH